MPPRGSPGSGGPAAAVGAVPGGPDPGGSRRQSLMDRLKRAASQPSLGGLPSGLSVPKGIVKAAEALLARSDSGGNAGAPAALRGSASAPGMADPPAAAKAPAAASSTPSG